MFREKLENYLKSDRKNYNGIDLIKFLCAIMVFFVHIPPLMEPSGRALLPMEATINFWSQNFLCRLAVPFYFVCSGFFLFKKMPPNELDVARVMKYCLKILYLLGAWTVLLFLGWTGHLWYLSATVVAVVFLSICLYCHVKLRYLIILGCVFYGFGLLGDSYYGIIKPFVSGGVFKQLYQTCQYFISSSRNGLFMGYIFVLMGYIFAQCKVKLKVWTSLTLFVASVIGLFAEVFLLHKYNIPSDHNMYIFLLPAVFFLFAFASSLSIKDHPVYPKLRTVGVLIYYLHLFMNALVIFGNRMVYRAFHIDLLPVQSLVTLLVTLLAAFGIEWLSHKEKFKWIRWFVS